MRKINSHLSISKLLLFLILLFTVSVLPMQAHDQEPIKVMFLGTTHLDIFFVQSLLQVSSLDLLLSSHLQSYFFDPHLHFL